MGTNKRKAEKDSVDSLHVVDEEAQKVRHAIDALLSRTSEFLSTLEDYARDAARRTYTKTFYTQNGPEQAHGVFLCCEKDRLVHVEYVLKSGRSVVVVHDPPEVKEHGRLPSKRGKKAQTLQPPEACGAGAAADGPDREKDETASEM